MMTYICRLSSKFATKAQLNIPPHPTNVATLPCETFMSKIVRLLVLDFYRARYALRGICHGPVVCVCVCVSVREHICGIAGSIFTTFFVHVPRSRGSVHLWRRDDTLCNSGFMNGVTFRRNGRYGRYFCLCAISLEWFGLQRWHKNTPDIFRTITAFVGTSKFQISKSRFR